ncbi:jg26547, partial [Pararge aegeria aegeria]
MHRDSGVQRHPSRIRFFSPTSLSKVNLTISEEEREHLLESNNIALFVDNLRAETAGARLAL